MDFNVLKCCLTSFLYFTSSAFIYNGSFCNFFDKYEIYLWLNKAMHVLLLINMKNDVYNDFINKHNITKPYNL